MTIPVTRDWLAAQYEHLNCVQIARLVQRHPKTVWNWLKSLGIQTRGRGSDSRSGFQRGNTHNVGAKLSDAHKQALREARRKDGRIPALINGVHWMKALGRRSPNWKGGITPERQAFYSSQEWADACKAVWKRDDAFCQRCGLDHRSVDRSRESFHIHHVIPFAVKEQRAHVSNLILVCAFCHRWIHSRANHERRWLDAG